MFGKETTGTVRLRVKICGLTTMADALLAIEAGADALGFIFFPGSKRYVNPRTAADWMINLPVDVTKVAVLVNPTFDEVMQAASWTFIDAVQLHGFESPEFCRQVAEQEIPFAKALPVEAVGDPGPSANFFTDTVLLDSKTRSGFGGTGEAFDWSIGRKFTREHPDLKVMVAGGLTPANVVEAVQIMRPFGVDVTTGVESSPGRKDPMRVRDFVAAARSA